MKKIIANIAAEITKSLLTLIVALVVVFIGSFIFLSAWTFIQLTVAKLTFMVVAAELFVFSIIISAGILFPKNK